MKQDVALAVQRLATQHIKRIVDLAPASARVKPERVIRLFTQVAKDPALKNCTATSIISACSLALQSGLEVGVFGQAYVIPYKRTATLIPGYKGLMRLMRRGLEEGCEIWTDVVYDCDHVEMERGSSPKLVHRPALDRPKDAKFVGAYACLRVRDGKTTQFEFMSAQEIDGIRARSKSSNSGPWVTDLDQMRKKTAIRRLANYVDLQVEAVEAIQAADQYEFGNETTPDIIDLGTLGGEEDPDETQGPGRDEDLKVDARPSDKGMVDMSRDEILAEIASADPDDRDAAMTALDMQKVDGAPLPKLKALLVAVRSA